MRKFPLLALVVFVFCHIIAFATSGETFIERDFSSPEIYLQGTEVVDGKVRLRIGPEQISDKLSLRLEKIGGDNWVSLENIESWADYDGKAMVGVKDEYGRSYIYVLWRKGSYSDAFRRYNVSANRWEVLSSPTESGLDVVKNGVCMAWDGGRYIYVMRGGAYSDFYRDFWRYDIKTNTWEILENTPWYQGAGNAMAWVRLDGKEYIYAIIGTTSSSAAAGRRGMVFARFNIAAWEMDPDNEPSKWEVIQWVGGYSRYGVSGTIPYGCDDGSSMVWTGDNYLYYLVGAYNETLSGLEESHFLRYHLKENRWEELAPIPYNGRPEDRSGVDDGGTIVWAGDYIYAVKGGDGAGHDYADNFYRYCISTNSWEKLANLPEGVGRRNGSRLAAIDGVVYFLRGHGSTGFWKYNPPLFSTAESFYSRVIDVGAETDWGKISWSYSKPDGIVESVFQTSDEPSALPDGSNRVGQIPIWYPADHPVISEFATRGPDNAYQEFIEIYNPTSSDVDLTGWKIQYRSVTGTSWYDRVVFPSGAKIPAYGFYLAVNGQGYPGGVIEGVQGDAQMTDTIADSGHLRLVDNFGNVLDAVSYGSGHNYTEEGPPAPNHGTTKNNKSVERRATPFSTIADMLVGGMHENLGNACDTNNNSFDFFVRPVRNPQNSLSAPEIPPTPMPLANYSQTFVLDGLFENISEKIVGQQSQVFLENQQTTIVLKGDNVSSPDLMNDEDGIYFEVFSVQSYITEENWENMAAWPGLLTNGAACYAENILSGRKYVYAHDTRHLYRYDIAADLWENIGPLPAQAFAGSGMVWTKDNYIYMTKGGSGTPNFWRYNIPENKWETLANTPVYQYSGSCIAWDGGDKIYGIFQAVTDNALYVFSISDNSWTRLYTIVYGGTPRSPGSGSSLVAVGGYLYYAVGGMSQYWRYNIADNTWDRLAGAPGTWGAGGAQEVINENIIYAVGFGSPRVGFGRFIIPENRWVKMTDLPAAISNANDRLVFDGSFTYLVRAYGDNSFWRYPKLSYQYDISTESSLRLNLPPGYQVENLLIYLKFSSENGATYYLGIYNWITGTYSENSLRHIGDNTVENVLVVRVTGSEYVSSDNLIKIRIRSSEPIAHKLLADRLVAEIQVARNQYALRWGYVFSGLDNSYENAEIMILGFSDNDENIEISVWKNSTSNWVKLGVLPASPNFMSFKLSDLPDYLIGGENLFVKFEDSDSMDWTQTTIYIDYLAVRAVKSYGTSIVVEVRFGSDNDPTDEPFPPENWTDWIIFNVGDNLAFRSRYLQYRIQLFSTDFRFSPLVEVLEIEHLPLIYREGIFVSQPLLLGYVDSWGELKFDVDTPTDTSIEFFTRSSPDGFLWSEWEPLDSRNIRSPVYNCRYLQVKAILYGFGSLTPVLKEYSIEYVPDKTPPIVTVSEPRDGFVTTQDKIIVRGTVSDANPVRLEINGMPVIFEPGAFEKEVRLSPGQNVIRIVASDVAGNKREILIRGTMEMGQPIRPAVPPSTYFVAAMIVGGVIAGISLIYIFAPAFVKVVRKGNLVFLSLALVFPILFSGSAAALSTWEGSWVSDYNDFRFGEFENVASFTSGVLALQPEEYWGNDFAASYYYTEWTNLDSFEKKVSIRFVAQASKTLTGFMIYLYQTGTDLTWRFRLELDDGTGKPSGILAWSNAWQTLKVTSSKWWTVDLLSPGMLRKGETYHIVISWENFGVAPSSQDFINIRSLWPFNQTWINGLVTNNNRGVLIFDGSSWKDLGREPVYILNFSDKTYEGNPYYTLRTDAYEIGVFGDNAKGERFQTDLLRRVCGIEVYARKSGTPHDNLYLVLQRGASTLASVSVGDSTTIENRWGWVGALFDAPLSLSPAQYVVGLKSPGSTSGNRYDVCLLGTYSSSPHPDLTFSGTTACFVYSTNGGITWSTKSKMQDDIPFRFIESFKKSGIFTSRIFDAGDIMKWERLNWDGRILDGTSLVFQTRTSTDNVRWSPWEDVGPDSSITSPPGRYIQYRVMFTTQSEYVTPRLNRVLIYFSDASPPKIVSATPRSGQTVFSTTPTIEIVLDDISGIDQDSIVLKVDGQKVDFSYDPATKTVWFLPDKGLSTGEHEIFISLQDGAGNLLEERWTFLVSVEEGLRVEWILAALVVAILIIVFVIKTKR
ncbi:MAG: lamin tail domain-containing protein [Candidatus Hadarchaeales archaeon]